MLHGADLTDKQKFDEAREKFFFKICSCAFAVF